MSARLAEVLGIYQGSNGDATMELYARLAALGPIGKIAVNLFRAQKASERAKVYRRGYARVAYDKKQWAIDNLCRALDAHAVALGIEWGWGEDAKQPIHRFVLYVELPTGQVSFHTSARSAGPDHMHGWDERPGMGPERICRWAASLLDDATDRRAGDARHG